MNDEIIKEIKDIWLSASSDAEGLLMVYLYGLQNQEREQGI